MTLTKLSALLAAALLAPAIASATPVVIENSSVRAGVSDYGTLGSNSNTPPGILFDPTATSNYGINDFLTPGTPFEGFYIGNAAGSLWGNNNNSGGEFSTTSLTSLSSTSAQWVGVSSAGLQVSNTYTLATVGGRSAIAISTVLTNLTGSELAGLSFLRTLDPDPDVNAFGSYFTTNSVVGGTQACGTGPSTGQTICVYADDAHFAGVAGVSSGWSEYPSTYLAGVNDGNGDYAIGVAFNLGNLADGASVSLSYGYALGASIDVVTQPVPEPETYALMGLGLGVLGFVARRRRQK